MSNMTYCRFRNTLKDLIDCQDALRNTDIDELSEDEQIAAYELIKVCNEIAESYSEEIQ